MTYDDRYADAIQALLGFANFRAVNSQGLIIVTHVQGATFTVWPHRQDKRKPVEHHKARRALQQGVSALQRNMAHYTDKAHTQAVLALGDMHHTLKA